MKAKHNTSARKIIRVISALQNLCKSVHGRLLLGSCFKERCLIPGLTCSPQAYLSAELAVVYFTWNSNCSKLIAAFKSRSITSPQAEQ